MSKMSNKVYDALKYVALIALPSFTTFYGVLSSTWGWNYTAEILTTLTALDVLLGELLRLSSKKYNKEVNNEQLKLSDLYKDKSKQNN